LPRSRPSVLTDNALRRYDLPARDLVRVTTSIWNDRPDLKIAFTGSSSQLSDLDAYIIKLCKAIDAAALAAAISAYRVDQPNEAFTLCSACRQVALHVERGTRRIHLRCQARGRPGDL